ncbi:MAG: RsmD family RNA methyltransferase [Lutibacter sp.]|jgi:16S rRNA (guanine(966)-N(2))-methyltransferase RsmD|nr:RsmD family RNA methyltransferase [Lutibacter sp.]
MRIISGLYKNKRLQAPKNLPVRPTTDMAKEALFNIINNRYYFDSIKVLDLFSGTGNISIEFASRGTQDITAVDSHRACIKYIKKTADALDLNIQTVGSDVYTFLSKAGSKFDLIFADPPYDFTGAQFEAIVSGVFDRDLLAKDGLLIIEHSKRTKLDHLPKHAFSKKYGGNMFDFFEK